MSDSGSFEHPEDTGSYNYVQVEDAPSPKRARYDETEFEAAQTEIVATEEGDEAVITVPQSQFEIEINSQQELSSSGSPPVHLPQPHDLGGPSFGVIQDGGDLSPLEVRSAGLHPTTAASEDTSTLTAIGRVLLQMQQQQVGGESSTPSATQQSQLVLTNMASESGQPSTAPLYVMIPPSSSAEILQAMGQSRAIAPKVTDDESGNGEDVRKDRDAQRKATHNEVERRRRDRINELIKSLAQIVPGCQKKDASTGNIVGYVYSKGTVLDKTVEYLKELMQQNEQLSTTAKLAEKSANALSVLQNQITVLEKENAFLRAQIIQLGIDAANNSQSLNRQFMGTSLAQSLLNSSTATASPPVSASSVTATQQLLLTLAQSLTQGPSAHPHLAASPPRPLPVSQLATLLPSQPCVPTTPLLTSLVQTLASIAGTTTTQANTLPKVSQPTLQSQSQPAIPVTAAASLINTLLMAQNVLSGGGATGQEGVRGEATSVFEPRSE